MIIRDPPQFAEWLLAVYSRYCSANSEEVERCAFLPDFVLGVADDPAPFIVAELRALGGNAASNAREGLKLAISSWSPGVHSQKCLQELLRLAQMIKPAGLYQVLDALLTGNSLGPAGTDERRQTIEEVVSTISSYADRGNLIALFQRLRSTRDWAESYALDELLALAPDAGAAWIPLVARYEASIRLAFETSYIGFSAWLDRFVDAVAAHNFAAGFDHCDVNTHKWFLDIVFSGETAYAKIAMVGDSFALDLPDQLIIVKELRNLELDSEHRWFNVRHRSGKWQDFRKLYGVSVAPVPSDSAADLGGDDGDRRSKVIFLNRFFNPVRAKRNP